MKKVFWIILIILIILLLLWWFFFKHNNENPPSIASYYCDTCYKTIRADTTQQIVVWRQPNSDDSYAREWLDSIRKNCGDFKITLFCGTCDSSLMLLTGPGVKTFIQGNGGTKGGGSTCRKNCPPSGDSLYWSVNLPVEFNDAPVQFRDTGKRIEPADTTGFSDTSVTVAVFDTGIDPGDITKYLYNNPEASCLNPSANNGWNFPDKNANTTDNYNPPLGHGEMVSRLIVDQAAHYKLNNVKILPVKIHDQNGKSDLFSVLCGFAYAKERGAKIINASFGYYSPKTTSAIDSNATLLKAYIKYYLTNNNILLVAAAGNKNVADNGNLDSVNFYPASLAADPELPNVIAVTTVYEADGKVSPTQNYSANVVDIGINANAKNASDQDYYFINPKYSLIREKGSSYATPILAGILCSHYNIIKTAAGSSGFNKANIFSTLFNPVYGLGTATNFNNQLKYGVMKDNSKP